MRVKSSLIDTFSRNAMSAIFHGAARQTRSAALPGFLNSTRKSETHLESAEEAQALAHKIMPSGWEYLQASVAHRRRAPPRPVRLPLRPARPRTSWRMLVKSVGEMDALTEMESETDAVGSISTTMNSVGSFDGAADSTGMVLSPTVQMLGPSAPNASVIQYPLSEVCLVASLARAGQRMRNCVGEAAWSGPPRRRPHPCTLPGDVPRYSGAALALPTPSATPRGSSRSCAISRAFHGKENELYFAGERIRALPIGSCFVAYRRYSHPHHRAPPPETALRATTYVRWLPGYWLFAHAIPREEAEALIKARRSKLLGDAIIQPPPIPAEPVTAAAADRQRPDPRSGRLCQERVLAEAIAAARESEAEQQASEAPARTSQPKLTVIDGGKGVDNEDGSKD